MLLLDSGKYLAHHDLVLTVIINIFFVCRTSREAVYLLLVHPWQTSHQGTSSPVLLPCPPSPSHSAAGQGQRQVPSSPQPWLLRRVWRSSACLLVAGSEAWLMSALRVCTPRQGCSMMMSLITHRYALRQCVTSCLGNYAAQRACHDMPCKCVAGLASQLASYYTACKLATQSHNLSYDSLCLHRHGRRYV